MSSFTKLICEQQKQYCTHINFTKSNKYIRLTSFRFNYLSTKERTLYQYYYFQSTLATGDSSASAICDRIQELLYVQIQNLR